MYERDVIVCTISRRRKPWSAEYEYSGIFMEKLLDETTGKPLEAASRFSLPRTKMDTVTKKKGFCCCCNAH